MKASASAFWSLASLRGMICARDAFVRLSEAFINDIQGYLGPKGAGLSPQFRLIDGVSRVLNSELDTAARTTLRFEGEAAAR